MLGRIFFYIVTWTGHLKAFFYHRGRLEPSYILWYLTGEVLGRFFFFVPPPPLIKLSSSSSLSSFFPSLLSLFLFLLLFLLLLLLFLLFLFFPPFFLFFCAANRGGPRPLRPPWIRLCIDITLSPTKSILKKRLKDYLLSCIASRSD